jgi:hypothetical protein
MLKLTKIDIPTEQRLIGRTTHGGLDGRHLRQLE